MSAASFDPSILQDFLTESGELLEQLEGDLVQLESTPDDLDLINKVFRALHTIKGSASFLSLTNLVEIAHAAESALNAARNKVIRVDAGMMTHLLAAVDVVRTQMAQVAAGEELATPDHALVGALTDLGLGKQAASATVAAGAGATSDAPVLPDTPPPATPQGGLDLPPGKADLLEFLVADLEETLKKVTGQVDALADAATRPSACATLVETGDALVRSIEFFEFEPMSRLARLLILVGETAAKLDAACLEQVLPRARGIAALLSEQTSSLAKKKLVSWPLDTLCERVQHLTSGEAPAAEQTLPPGATPEAALVFDGVRQTGSSTRAAAPIVPPSAPLAPSPAPANPTRVDAASDPAAEPKPESRPETKPEAKTEPKPEGKAEAKAEGKGAATAVDQTIRVEVSRLEVLMNLVGELVLQKNRISAISRQIAGRGGSGKTSELHDALTLSTGTLDRVTSDIQIAVMRTRLQPLEKIFGKYPRLIRDLSIKTGKKLQLVIEGGETEVDKSVIEELGDPLVHLLRNSADHGIEMPEDRVKAGKGETGTITLRASHRGSHVLVQVIDDGRGLLREKIGKKALERGLVNAADLASMTDKEVYRFIFEAGFSTAEKVTDLSGRGVGMDVVRSNIQKISGTIELDSVPGHGSTVSIKIPLTVAIMPAMLVGVGEEIYAIPLGSIVEIVKPEPDVLSTIQGKAVMRLRDSVLPLVSGPQVFGIPSEKPLSTPFVVVVQVEEKRVGLMVTRMIGQQEIVIKRLDELCDKNAGSAGGGPISGATVRDDGGVSLIVDVTQLVRLADPRAAA